MILGRRLSLSKIQRQCAVGFFSKKGLSDDLSLFRLVGTFRCLTIVLWYHPKQKGLDLSVLSFRMKSAEFARSIFDLCPTSPRRHPLTGFCRVAPPLFLPTSPPRTNIISKRHSYISIHTHSNHGATASRVQHQVSLVVITSRRARRASSAGSALPTEREPPERLAGSRVLHFRCRAFCLSRDSSGGRPRPPPCSTAGLT